MLKLNSTQKIVETIESDSELKPYQKKLLIDAIGKKLINPDEWFSSYFPATMKEVTKGFEYFPMSVKEMILGHIIDAKIGDRIKSLIPTGKYHDILLSYFEGDIVSTKNKYGTVAKIITDLWVNSRKDPSIFENSQKFEPILQDIPNYRDHFIHSFYVFSVGYYVINKLSELIGTDFREYLGSNAPNLTWMLASTFHDVAYPIERIDSWLGTLIGGFIGISPKNYFNFENIIPNIYYDFMKMICRWHKNPMHGLSSGNEIGSIDWPLYNELNSKLLEKNHGVLSGLILAHQLAARERFAEYGDAWDFFNMHLPACHAICLHALDVKIDFSKHPFAFLLVLFDELQDWGRPSKMEEKEKLFLQDLEVVNVDVPEIRITVAVSEERKEELVRVLKSRLETSKKVRIVVNEFGNGNILSI